MYIPMITILKMGCEVVDIPSLADPDVASEYSDIFCGAQKLPNAKITIWEH